MINKFKQGFTLVEMLLVMGITGILLVVLSQVFGSIISLRFKSEATSAIAQDSRYLVTRLAYDLARASSITQPGPGATGNSLSLIIGGQTYLYQVQGGSLTLSVDSGAAEPLNGVGTRLTAAVFTRYPDLGNQQSIRLDLTIESTLIQPGITSQSRRILTTLATR